jgi:hypothetical protein
VFVEDLTPIWVKEMPPSNIFFSKKRSVPIKMHRVLYDGQAQEETYFSMDVADSLGAFATTN